MLGQDLLVAPVFGSDTTDTEYYLPTGRWTSLWNRTRKIDGPRWMKERVAYDDIPVWIRENSVVCSSIKPRDKPDWDYAEDIAIAIYHPREGAAIDVVVPTGKGSEIAACLKIVKNAGKLSVEIVSGHLTSWNVELIGCSEKVGGLTGGVLEVGGGEAHAESGVIRAKVNSGERVVTFELA